MFNGNFNFLIDLHNVCSNAQLYRLYIEHCFKFFDCLFALQIDSYYDDCFTYSKICFQF